MRNLAETSMTSQEGSHRRHRLFSRPPKGWQRVLGGGLQRCLVIEALEDRTLLAVAPATALAHTDYILGSSAPAASASDFGAFTPAQIRQAYGVDAIKFG